MSSEINKALETFYNGDPLSDGDLVMLRNHALETSKLLSHMGQRFGLAYRETLCIVNTCENFVNAREKGIRFRKGEG